MPGLCEGVPAEPEAVVEVGVPQRLVLLAQGHQFVVAAGARGAALLLSGRPGEDRPAEGAMAKACVGPCS
ncbi:hypothetical protein [Nocardiopsis synnemataformans]|uniref:hypothetical protein n=1 Tax=Nocardiopsis synnemataformans TaxID=61305 RepID=UPI003EBC71EA